RVSLSDAWVTGRGLPYYPVDNRVVAVRDVDVLPDVPCSDSYSFCLGGLSQLFIFPYFHHSMRGVDTFPNLSGCGFFLRSSSSRGGVGDPCCYSKKFDSLKNWNNRFFWIDASVCPLSTSWFNGTFIVKDPLPVDEAVDLPCVELLNENRTLIRKYPETFLCFLVLSRSFTETDVRPTLLHDNDEEMGLLDFVKSADPFKVKVEEQTLAENERKKMVAFVFGSPLVKKTQTEGVVISDSRPSMAGKSPTALQRLIRQGEQAATCFGSAAAATEDATSSFVNPTLERALEDAPHDNVVPLVSSSQAGASVPVAKSTGDGHPSSAPELETGALSTNLRLLIPLLL
ncbi:hypothetical protein Tco_0942328, partial [Tanacetum coccineum]